MSTKGRIYLQMTHRSNLVSRFGESGRQQRRRTIQPRLGRTTDALFPPPLGASEEENLLIQLKELQLKSEGMSASMEGQKRDIKALHDSLSSFAENLETRIDILAGALGSLGNLNDEELSNDYP